MKNVFRLTDHQWALVIKRLKLPTEARVDVEFAIHAYREQRALWRRTPAEVTKLLERTSAAASKLAKLLEQLEDQGRLEITEAWPISRRSADNKIETMVANIKELSIACASAQASDMDRPFLLDQLIVNLDKVLHAFTGSGVSRGKPAMAFLSAACSITEEGLGTGAVEEAIKRLQGRGEIKIKKSRKSTAEIHR